MPEDLQGLPADEVPKTHQKYFIKPLA